MNRALWLTSLALLLGCPSDPPDSFPDGGDGTQDAGLAGDASVEDTPSDAGPATPAFRSLGDAPHECMEDCDNWPTGGTLRRFDVEETYGDVTHQRSFYVFVPDGLEPGAPTWIHLHGGTGSAQRQIENFTGFPIARGEAVTWRRNTDTCQYDPYRRPPGFVAADGSACSADVVRAQSREPVVLVFPEGIMEPGDRGRHWEDGRIPSPGFGTDEQHRDDVGFLDHVVETLLTHPFFSIDPDRIYLSGTSNGGMMVHRVLCEMGPNRPSLARIAAVTSLVSAVPEGIAEGLEGRPRCDPNPHVVPTLYVAGHGFPTPDDSVDGDGFVPWGEPGGVFETNSPDGGWLLGVEDSYALLQRHLDAAAGEPGREEVSALGAFTERRRYVAGGQELEFLGVEGGHHLLGGTRFDFTPMLRAWAFMSGWERSGDRVVARESSVDGDS